MVRTDKLFWEKLDSLIANSEFVIDRPKGSCHPGFSDMYYPLDYGYLRNTKSSDGNEIDIWVGSEAVKVLDQVLCTVDIVKNDVEIKLICGCTEEEKGKILSFHNNSEYMSAIYLNRKR